LLVRVISPAKSSKRNVTGRARRCFDLVTKATRSDRGEDWRRGAGEDVPGWKQALRYHCDHARRPDRLESPLMRVCYAKPLLSVADPAENPEGGMKEAAST
jgi:hypothetical protein